MANLNQLIITAADYKVLLIIPKSGNVPAQTFSLLTVESISYNNAREEETIYAIGEEEPIGQKRNAVKYSGKMTMQVGEVNAILSLTGMREATQIANATLAITAIQGGFSRVYTGMYINTESVDIKAKDKQSICNLDWNALGIT
jgi:hypothetical protein